MCDLKLKSSSQTTLMPPSTPTAICGASEPVVLVVRLTGFENVAPPSVEWLKKTPRVMVSLSHTTLRLPLASAAICGLVESAGSLERRMFTRFQQVTPPSVDPRQNTCE